MRRLILTIVQRIMRSREPDEIIGDGPVIYMRRWYAIPRNRFLNVYLHRFTRSDDDRVLHDHPWASLSLLLRGALLEHTAEGERPVFPGEWRYRPAAQAHRIDLVSKDAVTIFITGPKTREWGFHCPDGWKHHEDFDVEGCA